MTKFSKLLSLLLCVLLLAGMIASCLILSPFAEAELPQAEGDSTNDQVMMSKKVAINKNASGQPDGTYQLTLESYATGSVIYETVEKEQPADVVLVLDTSTSMTYDFDGNSTRVAANQRLAALKTAATEFIKDMQARYKADESDHRIGIVTYNQNAVVRQGLTKLSSDTAVAPLLNTINNLSTGNYTSTDLAMDYADQMIMTASEYTGANAIDSSYRYNTTGCLDDRHRVIILFTDGVPCNSTTGGQGTTFYSQTELALASKAISYSYAAKQKGVQVYGVGIFENANKDVYYGSREAMLAMGFASNRIQTSATSNTADQSWRTSNTIANNSAANTALNANRFMNYLTSNVPDAQGMELSQTNYGYTITTTRAKKADNFYFTADNAEDLIKEFKTISESIKSGGTTIALNEKATVKDIISNYFNLPKESTVSDIHLYLAPCLGVKKTTDPSTGKVTEQYLFGDRIDANGPSSPVKQAGGEVKAIITDFVDENDRRTVSVTGFDFTKYYVAANTETDGTGWKLIIEFDILPIEGFKGGNHVPTNDPASGIYDEDGKAVGNYEKPYVNIETETPSGDPIEETEWVIYQGQGVSIYDMVDVPQIDDLTYDFVDLKVFLGPKSDTVTYAEALASDLYTEVTDGIFKPEVSTLYPAETIHIFLVPKPEYTVVEGFEPATEKHASSTEDFYIYVLKPTIAVGLKDVTGMYGTAYTFGAGQSASPFTVTWAEDVQIPGETYTKKTTADVSEGHTTPTVTASDLYLEYDSSDMEDEGTLPKKDVTVTAKARFQSGLYQSLDAALKAKVVYTTTCACEKGCEASRDTTSSGAGSYLVHVGTDTLVVKTAGGSENDTYTFRVLDETGALYTTLSVTGNGEVYLTELPVGTYTVVPTANWAWRYTTAFSGGTGSGNNQAVLNDTTLTKTITCTLSSTDTTTKSASDIAVNTYTAK